MGKEVKCPWCDEKTEAKKMVNKNDHGNVVERRCTKCDKILSSYLVGEGDFFPNIRVFEKP